MPLSTEAPKSRNSSQDPPEKELLMDSTPNITKGRDKILTSNQGDLDHEIDLSQSDKTDKNHYEESKGITNSESTSTGKDKNNKIDYQKLPKSWLDPESRSYKPWANVSKLGSIYVYDVWCAKDILVSSLYGAKGHLKTNKTHLEKQEDYSKKNPVKLEDESNELENDISRKKTKLFELELCSLLIELNLSFQSIESLLGLIKRHTKAHYIKNTKLNRHNAAEMIKTDIQCFLYNEIKKKLEKTFFSVILDEVTDLTKKKFLALMVQFFDKKEGMVCKLLALKECSIDSSAESLYQILDKEILSTDCAQNLIALVSDGAKVMNGITNSVLTKLKEQVPQTWYLWCICHCLNLVAKKACGTIPTCAEDLLNKISGYFISPKRTAEFNSVLYESMQKVKKILRPAKTRWLSLQEAYERLLELWPSMENYFMEKEEDDMLALMQDPLTKTYVEFLSIFLKKINTVNQYFQAEVSEIFQAKDQLVKAYVSFSNHVLKPSIKLNDKFNVSLENKSELENSLMNDEEIYNHFLRLFKDQIRLSRLAKPKAFEACKVFREFILEVMKQLKEYLPYNDIVFNHISCLDPDTSSSESWMALAERFSNIVSSQDLADFYDNVSNWMLDQNDLKALKKKYTTIVECHEGKGGQNNKKDNMVLRKHFDVVQFYQDEIVTQRYSLISQFALTLLSLPHSSASVERAFSQLKLIKSEKRNRLGNDTLESLLFMKINNYNLEDPTFTESWYQDYQIKHPTKKRKLHQMLVEENGEEQEDCFDTFIENEQDLKKEQSIKGNNKISGMSSKLKQSKLGTMTQITEIKEIGTEKENGNVKISLNPSTQANMDAERKMQEMQETQDVESSNFDFMSNLNSK